jgi:hypothetical protein
MELWKYMVEYLMFSSEDQCRAKCAAGEVTANGFTCLNHKFPIETNDVIGIIHKVTSEELMRLHQ